MPSTPGARKTIPFGSQSTTPYGRNEASPTPERAPAISADSLRGVEIVVSVIVGVLLIIGALGIIIPVLPGSTLMIIALLVWAIAVGGATGWVVFGIGALLCVLGISASTVITGTRLKNRRIPNRSILAGGVLGVIGIFVIPVVGLFVGFIAGLYGSEWHRLRDARLAWEASLVAIKSVGLGMLVEFGCACAAIAAWIIGLFVYF